MVACLPAPRPRLPAFHTCTRRDVPHQQLDDAWTIKKQLVYQVVWLRLALSSGVVIVRTLVCVLVIHAEQGKAMMPELSGARTTVVDSNGSQKNFLPGTLSGKGVTAVAALRCRRRLPAGRRVCLHFSSARKDVATPSLEAALPFADGARLTVLRT